MIPIKLTIEGLYSYQQRQEIDFSELTNIGLFGIFGATGSGKSTILEAITFALYGQTERLLEKGDDRNYNMLNLRSNRMYIAFDFYNFEQKKYRAIREFKRNPKKYDSVAIPPNHVTFYLVEGEQITPQENANAEQILGLSYQNFKRTIIIPQGQFKEFLELKPTDRTKMLKEIFNLHRFDLSENVAKLNVANKSQLDILDGQLMGFETVSEEEITHLTTQFQQEKTTLNQLQTENKTIDENYQRLKSLKSDFELLQAKKINFKTLQEQVFEIESLEQKRNQFVRVKTVFENLLNEHTKKTKNLAENKTELEKATQNLTEITKSKATAEQQLLALKPKFDALSNSRLAEMDLQAIIQTQNFQTEIVHLSERIAKGKQIVDTFQAEITQLQTDLKAKETILPSLKKQQVDAQLLFEVNYWYLRHDELKKEYEQQILKITETKTKIQSTDLKLENYTQAITHVTEQKSALDLRVNALQVQQQLAHYTHELQDGLPCPLCGSAEHPNIVHLADVSDEIDTLKHQLNVLENDKIILQTLENETQLLAEIQAKITAHQQAFIWKDFDPNDRTILEKVKRETAEIVNQIEETEKYINTLRSQIEKKQTELTTAQQLLEKIKLEEHTKTVQIQSNIENLKQLNFADYSSFSVVELQQKLTLLKAENDKINQDFQTVTNLFNSLNIQFSAEQKSQQILAKNEETLQLEIKDLDNQLLERLATEKINSVENVQVILAQNIDIENVDKKIQQFKIDFETLKNSIVELEQKFTHVSFNQQQFETVEIAWKESSATLKEKNDFVVKLTAELERMKQQFEAKKQLLIEKEKLDKRASNLRLLTNLFSGQGFVQYVSSIYLNQLCAVANERFLRLTRNQLRLQLNEKNNFEVIDYLNDGNARNVKTLSGGQLFQVSLSLALALAESVQSNVKADRNFFFIDEGFGTQDNESISLIFETLLHLNRENKIVGIISHVDELKERIPISLVVENDKELGSLIKVNG